MQDVLKNLLGDQKRLVEILGVSRTQAWRIWTGKSKLTPVNEKYIWRVLKDEAYDSARETLAAVNVDGANKDVELMIDEINSNLSNSK